MKIKWVLTLAILASLVLVNGGRARLGLAEGPRVGQAVVTQAALGTAFTYQGQLSQGGNPVNGSADFLFSLFDSASAGAQIGVTQTAAAVNVSNGFFTVELDFGSNVFNGEARWLEIAVRQPAGSGSYTPLSPRQALTAAPYALYATAAPAALPARQVLTPPPAPRGPGSRASRQDSPMGSTTTPTIRAPTGPPPATREAPPRSSSVPPMLSRSNCVWAGRVSFAWSPMTSLLRTSSQG